MSGLRGEKRREGEKESKKNVGKKSPVAKCFNHPHLTYLYFYLYWYCKQKP